MSEPLRVLDLFSGIGGFSLGLERTGGFKTVAFCEIDPFCRRVLAKRWPDVKQYDDVRTLSADSLQRDGIDVDVICGGFPCQDISEAGKRVGLGGERSGLWSEIARLTRELRPRFVFVENVAALLYSSGEDEPRGRDFGRVLGDLAAIGYDAEWHCIPAAAVDARHRLWIAAYPDEWREQDRRPQPFRRRRSRAGAREGFGPMADAYCAALVGPAITRTQCAAWAAEPSVDRVVDGIPRALVEPRLKALGNAVVPQIPELIGYAILAGADIKSAVEPQEKTGDA